MKFLSLLSLIFGTTSAHAIEGGHEVPATSDLMPALVQVLLFDQGKGQGFSCIGTLISKDFVITAAHCLISDEAGYLAGSSDGRLNNSEVKYYVYRGNMKEGWMGKSSAGEALGVGPGWIPVKRAFIPSRFGHTEGSHYNSDIGLLHVNTDGLNLPLSILPPLMSTEQFQHMQPISVVGAGPVDQDEQKDFVHIFREIRGFMMGPGPMLNYRSQKIQFQNDEGVVSSCTKEYMGLDHGDSGGPALIRLDGKQFIWGVDSQGDTYTVLALHRDWMNEVASQVHSSTRFSF